MAGRKRRRWTVTLRRENSVRVKAVGAASRRSRLRRRLRETTRTKVSEGLRRSCRRDSRGETQRATTVPRSPKFPRTEARKLRSWGPSWLPPPKLIFLSLNVLSFRVIRSCPRQNEILPRVLKRHRYKDRNFVIEGWEREREKESIQSWLISRICKNRRFTGQYCDAANILITRIYRHKNKEGWYLRNITRPSRTICTAKGMISIDFLHVLMRNVESFCVK